MGVSGEIQLTSPEINGAPTMSSGTTFDSGGTGDVYNFSYDFASGSTFTFTGDFQHTGGPEFAYTDLSAPGLPGTFNLNPLDGTFTYTVTLAQMNASGSFTHSLVVNGTDGFSPDIDTINLTFVPCFAEGSLIATPDGEAAVEALQIGDLVVTADGRHVPVKWVGHVTASPMFNPADRMEPVLIRAGALGPGMPHSDLIVTADHGMVLDGCVINASALVNGTSIQWHDWKRLGETITYFHVETEHHDVILANGAASETYLDIPDRQSFENFHEYAALYGAETPIAESALPRISSARLLPDGLRARLDISPPDELGSLPLAQAG